MPKHNKADRKDQHACSRYLQSRRQQVALQMRVEEALKGQQRIDEKQRYKGLASQVLRAQCAAQNTSTALP